MASLNCDFVKLPTNGEDETKLDEFPVVSYEQLLSWNNINESIFKGWKWKSWWIRKSKTRRGKYEEIEIFI